MAFGDTLRLAYQQATEIQREAARRVASGKDWVGKQSDAIAAKAQALARQGGAQLGQATDWLSSRTQEQAQHANVKAHQLAAAAEQKAVKYSAKAKALAVDAYQAGKDTAKGTAQAAKAVYQKAKTVTSAFATATATTACRYGNQVKRAVTDTLKRGMENAAARNREAGSWEAKSKAGVEADGRKYKTAGSENAPGNFEKKAEVKVQRSVEKVALFYGDEDNNVKIGVHKSALAAGYERDFGNKRDIYGLHAEQYFAAATAQAKGSAVKGLVEGSASAEALSVKASGMIGYVDGKGFKGVKAEAGAEASLIKGGVSGQVNITPKTLYDNSLGRIVGLAEPEWGELPAWTDHGIFVGAEAEAGIGAAAKGVAQLNAENMSVKAGLLVGAGPMAGFYATFGIK